jgi:hypothetical protein
MTHLVECLAILVKEYCATARHKGALNLVTRLLKSLGREHVAEYTYEYIPKLMMLLVEE